MFGGGSPTAVPWKDGRPVMPAGGGEVLPPFDASSIVVDQPTGAPLPPPSGPPVAQADRALRRQQELQRRAQQRAQRTRQRSGRTGPKKKHGAWGGFVVLAIIVIANVAPHIHTHHSSGSSSSSDQVLSVGDTATIRDSDRGDASVVVSSATPSSHGAVTAPAPENGTYLVVSISVTATTTYDLEPDDFGAYGDATGLQFTTDGNAESSGLVAHPLAAQTVRAGQTVTGQLVFDVPDDVSDVELYAGDAYAEWDL